MEREREGKRRSWNQRPFQGRRRGCQSGKRPLTNSSLINGFQSAKNWQCIANDWQTDPLVLSVYFRPILSISLWLPAILDSPLFDGRVASNDGRCLRHVICLSPSLFSFPLSAFSYDFEERGIRKTKTKQFPTWKTRFLLLLFAK